MKDMVFVATTAVGGFFEAGRLPARVYAEK
jgi:hypothetical protein